MDNNKSNPQKVETPNVEAKDNSIAIGSIEVHGNVEGGIHIGNTIIQKFFNIFKSDAETLEQRNRRILLGHVENAWIKGVLDASLHGAALLDLGIKQDPEAVTKYPWTIKKESTDKTLPAGTSMLEIFDSIGMGRSLLILGAPGSGKTTMLLELARQLIARAREDVTYPIPMVFNLASWTEKLTLADWLAQELNNLYSVPRKIAPDWVNGNKLLLLLDGLDEVRQESRAKCVEAINAFRKEHGLTSLAVCSRSQDYADLNAKLSFEGAIEVQPLTQEQITEFLDQFGEKTKGIKHILDKDSDLSEMVETPLFLNIMLTTYQNNGDVNVRLFIGMNSQRRHLFDAYIERMFERCTENSAFKKQDVLHWLSWMATKLIAHEQIPFYIESIQPIWLDQKRQTTHNKWNIAFIGGLVFMLIGGLGGGLKGGAFGMLGYGLIFGLGGGLLLLSGTYTDQHFNIRTIDKLTWNPKLATVGLILILIVFLFIWLLTGRQDNSLLFFGIISGLIFGLIIGWEGKQINKTSYPGEKLSLSARNFLITFPIIELILGIILELVFGSVIGLYFGLFSGLYLAMFFGGFALIQHFALRLILARNNLLPWRLVPFLDHCVDLIFLRRVGGGYIFVHRLLMEHFAEMYVEAPTSKGN